MLIHQCRILSFLFLLWTNNFVLFVSISVLAVCFIIGHDVTVLFSPMALRTWLDAGAVPNQLICASDRVHRDPFHTRSVGTEVSAAAAVSLQAHGPFDFTHICSPCLLHHGNSAIPPGFCCARPSLCGQFRTNLLRECWQSLLLPQKTYGWLMLFSLPKVARLKATAASLHSSEPFVGSLNCSSPSSTSYGDGGDFRCWDPLQVNRPTFTPPLFTPAAGMMMERHRLTCRSHRCSGVFNDLRGGWSSGLSW